MAGKRLRTGFTTGSAAAAAAKAAVFCLAGRRDLSEVEIPLPEKGRMTIPIEGVELFDGIARAMVIKDGGDDPDATHRARIICMVRIEPERLEEGVTIKGGRGVGRVTRQGLPVAVGEAAINPAPRRQIRKAVAEALLESGLKGAVTVTVEVPDGEKIAKKTLNPRLGIVGGISILGTRGTVIPFSNEAYRETITLAMDVARAGGASTVVLSTGGRSEKFLRWRRPDLSESCLIQVADFFSFSLREAAKRGFKEIIYACFFGKLVKMAQGYPHTHARKSRIDFDTLARWCALAGMERRKARAIKNANTAREVLRVVTEDMHGKEIIGQIVKRALFWARKFSGPSPDLTYYLFDTEGKLLVEMREKGMRVSRERSGSGKDKPLP